MFNNATNVDASHSTFSEVHRDQHFYSRTHVQGNYTVNTIVQGNQVFQGSLGLENLYRASVPSAAFDSLDRYPAPACLPGTRLELLVRLADWVDNPSGNKPICWLSGLAGSGKSAVAQSIAEKYASRGRLAASFFFSRKEASRRRAHGFFPTLASQLLVFAPSFKSALLDALDEDVTIPTKLLLGQARRLLEEPIMSSKPSFPDPVLIVIDSLDECDDAKMADEIVRLLAGILRQRHWPLKVLFTSRAESHIVQAFQHSELQIMTSLLQLQDFDVDDDIRAYLQDSFRGIRKSMPAADCLLPWPSEDEIGMIVQRAAGLFIFAVTVVKYVALDSGTPVAQLQAVLQALQNGGDAKSALVHSPLDTLYLDALRRIPNAEKVRLVLGLVVLVFRPLSVNGLTDLLWNFQLNPLYIVKDLRSVLVTSEGAGIKNDDAVRIYHTSFRDFLLSSHRSKQYVVEPVVFHGILACACLELMVRHLATDMCNISDPSTKNCEIENLEKQCRLNIKEGVRYACRWFSHHLSQVPWDARMDSALILSLQGFASRCLLNWIEALSLTGELDSAVSSLREATEWLGRSPNSHEEISTLFREAERLLLMCYEPIQQAALQVYYSFPCVPTCAQIRATYAHELKDKYVVTHGLDDHWQPSLRSISTGASVKYIAISPSGRFIASAGDTPGVQLWDALTGMNTAHFHGNGTSSCTLVFSPSGDSVAIGYDTGAVDVWDVATGLRLLDPSQSLHSASVTGLAFSRSSLIIASGAADATIHVWDISTGNIKHSFAYHKGPILCLMFSPSDSLIASGSDDTTIMTSDVQSGHLIRTFKGHASKVNCIAFSSDGKTIASGSDDQGVRLWDTRTGVCLRTLAGIHKKPIRNIWITADNTHIVSACNMDIYMWAASSLHPSQRPQHIWSVNHFMKKQATMFPAWYAKLVKLVPADTLGRFAELDDGTAVYTAPSTDGMAIGCAYRTSLLFLDCSAPQKSLSKIRRALTASSTLDEPPLFSSYSDDHEIFMFTAVALTSDNTQVVTSTDSGVINIWNTSPRSSWKTFKNNLKRTAVDFWPAPDGRSLLVKKAANLQLVAPTGTLIKEPETGPDVFGPVDAFPSPDSRYFAYWAEYAWNVDKSFSIHIYDASTGARLGRMPGFFNITRGRFSSDSNLFVCAHGSGIVQIWELPSLLCKTTVKTGHYAITALEWVRGNTTLVVGSDKGCVEIRSVENGDVVHHIECSPSKISAFAVHNETLSLIIGHADGSIFVWDPSYTDVAPYNLFRETQDDAASDPDGVDFIKFVEGSSYRSICTRSVKGVICTWDLTRCLEQYAERVKEASAEIAAGEIVPTNPPPSHPLDPPSDAVPTSLTTLDSLSARDDSADLSDTIPGPTASLPPTLPQETSATATTVPATPTSTLPHPYLISRSEANLVYDRYLRSTYAVDVREGWVSCGSRRLFWLPDDLRPASPTALSAFEDRLTLLTRSQTVVCIDLSPMITGSASIHRSHGREVFGSLKP